MSKSGIKSSNNQSSSQIKRLYLGNKDSLEKVDLIELQKESWKNFLEKSLPELLEEFFPIEDYSKKNFLLELKGIRYDKPRYSLEECFSNKLTYYFPVYIKTKLTNKKRNTVKEQDVYFFNLPMMTNRGTFVINGIERAVISQISRAPGIYFTAEIDKNTGVTVYNAEVRPYIGAWLDFTISKNNILEAKINKKRKFYVTTLIKAFNDLTNEDIKSLFSNVDKRLIDKYLVSTLDKDTAKTKNEAVLEIYRKMKPGEPLVIQNAYDTLNSLFFSSRRYSLGKVGRYKINKKLNLSIPNEKKNHLLLLEDLIATISYLIQLTDNKGSFDDIDHLANRRIRTVGELVEMYGIRVGMVRAEREIKERMSMTTSEDDVLPSQLINSKAIVSAINSFFRTSQLSTIIDQTNPLAEIDNLRRFTVGGPGGIEKERASFSIRDISSSQYGRICPIRSPEGPNIGVVTYMALYAKINEYGFIETPYRQVEHIQKGNKKISKITNKVVYMQADDEEKYYITSNGIKINENNEIIQDRVPVRFGGDILETDKEKADYIDYSPRQVVGIAASLIPFLQHDDASRALMGTHMLCQAVPLLKPQPPVVGTGMEHKSNTTLGRCILAEEDGDVQYIDANKIIIKGKSGKKYEYRLARFSKTNKNVVFDQSSPLSLRQKVSKGQIVIDGPSSKQGELTLGQNCVVAYASMDGLGYEDGFVISDRLVKNDALTSVHLEEYIADVVDTKLGPEELTRDIPNIREEVLANLDKDGLIIVGSEVNGGDVLVGKVAPKGEKELSAEERLLRAIFGEKAKDVKDTTLRLPYGKKGTVVSVTIIDAKKDANELEPGVLKRIIVNVAEIRKIKVGDKLAGRHGNKGIISKILPEYDMPHLEDGTPVDVVLSPLAVLARMNLGQLYETLLGAVALKKNVHYALPVFDNISEDFIRKELEKVGYPVDGKVTLIDGRTGEKFEKPVLVGVQYILKLIHMVTDKFHARSTGPYSLVTQQPLGGKSQMGGQRFGEMEVWALQSHKVPYALQEMLTIKSDDVEGRNKAFEAIIKGLDVPQSNIPESFKVLVKELNALGLQIESVKPKQVEQ